MHSNLSSRGTVCKYPWDISAEYKRWAESMMLLEFYKHKLHRPRCTLLHLHTSLLASTSLTAAIRKCQEHIPHSSPHPPFCGLHQASTISTEAQRMTLPPFQIGALRFCLLRQASYPQHRLILFHRRFLNGPSLPNVFLLHQNRIVGRSSSRAYHSFLPMTSRTDIFFVPISWLAA